MADPSAAPAALVRLRRAVRRAVAAKRRYHGNLIDFYLADGGWAALVVVVRAVQADRPALNASVASEDELGSLVLEALETDIEDRDGFKDIHALGLAVERRIADEPQRWVEVPIANLQAPSRLVVLDHKDGKPRALLVPTVRSFADPAQRDRADAIERDLRAATGRPLRLRPRFTTGPSDATDSPAGDQTRKLGTDSRVGAVLFQSHPGPVRLARQRALTDARFAVALWCLANPPDEQADGFALWPSVADWQPLPYFSVDAPTVSTEADPRRSPRSDGGEYEYAEYVLPDEDVALQQPWRAFRAAPGHRPARALLSAAWALYVALHIPAHLQLPDRIVHLLAARNALCTPPKGVKGSADSRWKAVTRRLRLYDRLSKEMDVTDAGLIEDRVEVVRNLAVHAGASYAMVAGGPVDSTWLRGIRRDQLVPAATRADTALAATAIVRVASGLLAAADAAGYADSAYERHFVDVPSATP